MPENKEINMQMNKKNISVVAAVIIAILIGGFLVFGKKKTEVKSAEGEKSEGHGDHAEGGHAEGGHEENEELLKLTDDQIKASGIQFVEANKGELDIQVNLPGEIKLNADKVSHIIPRFGGAITQLRKNLGEKVQKGEVLAVIESNESLASYEIKALNAGTIIQKHATIGEVVPENTEVFVVADLDNLWVDMNVYPKDLPYVQVGQEVVISGQAKGLQANTKISYVGPIVSEHTRTALTRAILQNKDGKWRAGMFVTAKVSVEKVEVGIKVPKVSLQNIEGKESVFVQRAEGFEAVAVVRGREDQDFVEILDGLKVGDKVVSQGAFMLKAEKGKSEAEHDH